MSGVTEWVISGNEGTTEERLLIVFLCMSVCLVFSTGVKIVLIKYSGYRNIGKTFYMTFTENCRKWLSRVIVPHKIFSIGKPFKS